jgi:hypothetical protein
VQGIGWGVSGVAVRALVLRAVRPALRRERL